MFRIFLIIALALIVSSCSLHHSSRLQHQVEHMRKDALKKIDMERCAKENGKIEGVGMFATPSCVHYFPDGGKDCSDKSQCQGLCLLTDLHNNDLKIGDAATGFCQSSEKDQFGCFSVIESAHIVNSLCQD